MRFAYFAPGLAVLAGCASLLGVDFDRVTLSQDGGLPQVDRMAADGGDGLPPDDDADADHADTDAGSVVRPDDAGRCAAGWKACAGGCVAENDPLYGCTATSCDPCSVPNATATCAAGACAIGGCASGRGDCDGVVGNGCEVDLTSAHGHCGACPTTCAASEVCNQSACSASCGTLTNCSGSCVNVATDPAHCGSCAVTCPPGTNGTATCTAQVCGVACNGGYHACNGRCESKTSVSSCGASCVPCAAPANAIPTCDGTTCGFTCSAGFSRCGGSCIPTASDPTNCGSCGHDCLGGACQGGSCQPITLAAAPSSDDYAMDVVVDANSVYWTTRHHASGQTDATTSTVWRATKSGASRTALTTLAGGAIYLVRDGARIYWSSDAVYNSAATGHPFGSIATSGGAVTRFGGTTTAGSNSLAVDATSFYWAWASDASNTWTLQRSGKDGSNAQSFATGPSFPQRVLQTNTAADANYVYAAGGQSNDSVHVYRFDKNGTNRKDLGILPGDTTMMIEFGSALYVTMSDAGIVARVDKQGGGVTVVASAQPQPSRIAVDASGIYWTNIGSTAPIADGSVMRAPLAGGAAVTLARDLPAPFGIALDGAWIYWANNDNLTGGATQALVKLAK